MNRCPIRAAAWSETANAPESALRGVVLGGFGDSDARPPKRLRTVVFNLSFMPKVYDKRYTNLFNDLDTYCA